MHPVFQYLLLLLLVLNVSMFILLLHCVLQLVLFPPVLLLFIQSTEGFRQGLLKIENHRLSVDVRRRQPLVEILPVLHLLLQQFFLVIFLFLFVVEFPVDKVVSMRFPVFVHDLQVLLHFFFVYFLFVVLHVLSCNNVELFLLVTNQIHLSLNRNLNLPVFEIEIRQFLIVYHVVSIADRS